MNPLKTYVSWLWKIPVAGAVMTLGTMIGGGLATALGLEMPRPVGKVDQNLQLLLLFAASIAFATGLAVMNGGIAGRRGERWLALALFGFVIHGVGNTLEASIFATVGGEPAMLVMKLASTLLCALAVVYLFPATGDASLRERLSNWLFSWSKPGLAVRLCIGFIAFPFIYFLFGTLIVPIVTPYYDALDFLVIPPLPTILAVLFTRSLMLLLASLPIIAGWTRTRTQLVLALGFGHFVAVGLTDLLQAPFFPAVLRWTHSIEILIDSLCYALVLTWLLVSRHPKGYEELHALQQHA